jgi:hypothetical protein
MGSGIIAGGFQEQVQEIGGLKRVRQRVVLVGVLAGTDLATVPVHHDRIESAPDVRVRETAHQGPNGRRLLTSQCNAELGAFPCRRSDETVRLPRLQAFEESIPLGAPASTSRGQRRVAQRFRLVGRPVALRFAAHQSLLFTTACINAVTSSWATPKTMNAVHDRGHNPNVYQ